VTADEPSGSVFKIVGFDFMTLDEMMNRFRVASRELFNHFFHVSITDETGAPLKAAWDSQERFSHVQDVLFENMVCESAELTHAAYGTLQPEILVELRSDFCPIMLNREFNSGYWDFPLREVTRDARLLFIRFFDWDNLDYHDNRYVLVQVGDWPSHSETLGKQALIESHYVRFVRAASSDRQTTD
jgi:hypothetical protein